MMNYILFSLSNFFETKAFSSVEEKADFVALIKFHLLPDRVVNDERSLAISAFTRDVI